MRLVTAPDLLPMEPLGIFSSNGAEEPVADIINWLRPNGPHARAGTLDSGSGDLVDHDEVAVAVDAVAAIGADIVMPLPISSPFLWWEAYGWAAAKTKEQCREAAVAYCQKSLERGEHPYLSGGLDMFHALGAVMEPSTTLIRAALADNKSREVFDGLISADFGALAMIYRERMFGAVEYFEGLRVDGASRVLSLGVHTGWDIPFLACLGASTVHLVDPLGIEYLTKYAASFLKTAVVHRVAMESYTGVAYLPTAEDGQAIGFCNGQKSEHATRRFPCVSLDDFVTQHGDFDVIKMDTEGAEPAILWGGLASIRRMRPQLAISMYHNLFHYWSIPLWVTRHLRNYKLFIRCYSFTGVETILYAIPEESKTPEGLLQ